MGKLEGDDLRCGYHGLKFNASGACVEIPGQANIPPQARVRAYPVLEKFGWLWIWMGDTAEADPALIPNWWWADHPEWAFSKPEPIYVRCNYQLISDNVLDVTHLAYVHASSIGASSITEFPATTAALQGGGRLPRERRPLADRRARAAVLQRQFRRLQGRQAENRSHGAERAYARDREDHALFFRLRPEFRIEKRGDRQGVFDVDFAKVFNEDIPVLEAQQRMLELKPGAPRIDIAVAAAPLAARRMLQAMMAQEAKASGAKLD